MSKKPTRDCTQAKPKLFQVLKLSTFTYLYTTVLGIVLNRKWYRLKNIHIFHPSLNKPSDEVEIKRIEVHNSIFVCKSTTWLIKYFLFTPWHYVKLQVHERLHNSTFIACYSTYKLGRFQTSWNNRSAYTWRAKHISSLLCSISRTDFGFRTNQDSLFYLSKFSGC